MNAKKVLVNVQARAAKPGRYTGGELNQVVKEWVGVGWRVAMVFPDIYDIGMSNLGWMISYEEFVRGVLDQAGR